MSAIYETPITLRQMTCKCGGVWGCNEAFITLISEEGGFYHCPYCQRGRGWNEGRLQREKKSHAAELAAAAEKVRLAKHAQDQAESLAAKALGKARRTDAEMKRQKVRIHNGVCPCCNRTFTKLGQHMALKHPEYLK